MSHSGKKAIHEVAFLLSDISGSPGSYYFAKPLTPFLYECVFKKLDDHKAHV